jgi:hypothetical protein
VAWQFQKIDRLADRQIVLLSRYELDRTQNNHPTPSAAARTRIAAHASAMEVRQSNTNRPAGVRTVIAKEAIGGPLTPPIENNIVTDDQYRIAREQVDERRIVVRRRHGTGLA